ncbi:MAG: phosphoribosyltransferase [Chitinophagia bacterium]|nr:phosphoribosyltransferase [Chitinophagia bacterium]
MKYFTDRNEAALQLATKIIKHKSPQTLVLAIPRGGVPIGKVLAEALSASLDLLMAKKIGHPFDPEFAIGAVCANEMIIEEASEINAEYLAQQGQQIKAELSARYKRLTGRERLLSPHQKKVIITDDGIATGRTMLAAVRAIKKQGPSSLIVAVPVCSVEASKKVAPEVDELIACYYPDPFVGVGRFYKQFSQVTDEEVIEMLRKSTTVASPPSRV